MAHLTRSGRVIGIHPLGGDDFLRYVYVDVLCRDPMDDGTGVGEGGETQYLVGVFGQGALRLAEMFGRGERPHLVFSGRYSVRHVSTAPGGIQHEVSAEYAGIDLESLNPTT